MSDAPYFAMQKMTDVNCVVLAINNLFGEPVVSRHTLLLMKGKNRKNRNQYICQEAPRGLICQNKIIEHILKLINTEKLIVSIPTKFFFKGTSAVTWYDLRIQENKNADQFDTFFKKFHKHIIGIYGNKEYSPGIGHAVCVRRSSNGRNLWLLDSLNTERKRVSLNHLPVGEHKLQPFVVILKHTYFNRTTSQIKDHSQ
jgi:hypothetical protein